MKKTHTKKQRNAKNVKGRRRAHTKIPGSLEDAEDSALVRESRLFRKASDQISSVRRELPLKR